MRREVHAVAAGMLAGALAAATGCGSAGSCTGPGCAAEAACSPPAGCLLAIHVAGVCTCQAWQAVSTTRVELPYVVLSVVYTAVGAGNSVGYGGTFGGVLGSRWRAVVRSPGAADQPVAVTSVDGSAGWQLTGITPTTLAATLEPDMGWSWTSAVDLPAPLDDDVFVIWVNPSFLLRTTVTGERQGEWSWNADCSSTAPAYGCAGPSVLLLTAGAVAGTATVPASRPEELAFLASLSPAERADILAHDPLLDPAARTAAALELNPRFARMGDVVSAPGPLLQPAFSWTPCTGAPGDADLPVFTESAFPIPTGGSLVLQHTLDVTTPTCEALTPSLQLDPITAGCEIQATVYVDRAFGTFVTAPTASTPSCTTG